MITIQKNKYDDLDDEKSINEKMKLFLKDLLIYTGIPCPSFCVNIGKYCHCYSHRQLCVEHIIKGAKKVKVPTWFQETIVKRATIFTERCDRSNIESFEVPLC